MTTSEEFEFVKEIEAMPTPKKQVLCTPYRGSTNDQSKEIYRGEHSRRQDILAWRLRMTPEYVICPGNQDKSNSRHQQVVSLIEETGCGVCLTLDPWKRINNDNPQVNPMEDTQARLETIERHLSKWNAVGVTADWIFLNDEVIDFNHVADDSPFTLEAVQEYGLARTYELWMLLRRYVEKAEQIFWYNHGQRKNYRYPLSNATHPLTPSVNGCSVYYADFMRLPRTMEATEFPVIPWVCNDHVYAYTASMNPWQGGSWQRKGDAWCHFTGPIAERTNRSMGRLCGYKPDSEIPAVGSYHPHIVGEKCIPWARQMAQFVTGLVEVES